MSSRNSSALMAAIWYPREILVGWILLFNRVFACCISSPVRIMLEVVPSKHCSSCVRATSMMTLATGWSMSDSFIMVAPSLVITTSFALSTNMLSSPEGPSVCLTMSPNCCAMWMQTSLADAPTCCLASLTFSAIRKPPVRLQDRMPWHLLVFLSVTSPA